MLHAHTGGRQQGSMLQASMPDAIPCAAAACQLTGWLKGMATHAPPSQPSTPSTCSHPSTGTTGSAALCTMRGGTRARVGLHDPSNRQACLVEPHPCLVQQWERLGQARQQGGRMWTWRRSPSPRAPTSWPTSAASCPPPPCAPPSRCAHMMLWCEQLCFTCTYPSCLSPHTTLRIAFKVCPLGLLMGHQPRPMCTQSPRLPGPPPNPHYAPPPRWEHVAWVCGLAIVPPQPPCIPPSRRGSLDLWKIAIS